jgi:hypothetical protein
MEHLINAANRAIDRVLAVYHRPALMCSFGKDSMVLLHLLRARGLRLPVIFHRDPWWPEKYVFADQVIRDWDLEVYDWAPARVTLWEGKAIMAFTNHYQIGPRPQSLLQLPKNILPPEPGKKFICGLRDVLQRPTGSFNYPWDCVLIGHKSSDEDQIAGKVPLKCDIKQNAGLAPDAAFPLRQWTDADIWEYSAANSVPQQADRYADRGELKDKRANSDYAHVCIACCDRRSKAASVHCPKFDCEVGTVADQVPYESPNFNYYGEEKP